MSPSVFDDASPRRQLAAAIAAYMRGEIDNFAFDDAIWAAASRDKSLFDLTFTLWGAYDDVKRHSVRIKRPGWQFLRRCIAYLLTDEPAPRRFQRRVDRWELWPFQRWADLRRAAPALAAVALPAFDPAVHAVPIRTRGAEFGCLLAWIAVGLVSAAMLVCEATGGWLATTALIFVCTVSGVAVFGWASTILQRE